MIMETSIHKKVKLVHSEKKIVNNLIIGKTHMTTPMQK